MLCAAGVALLVLPACASAAAAVAIGWPFHGAPAGSPIDGSLDTRPAAVAWGDAMAKLGYRSRVYRDGQSARSVIEELPRTSVMAIFGHGNKGVMLTGGDGAGRCDGFAITGSPRRYLYCGHEDYALGVLPPGALRDTRLIIFGGCDTADGSGSAVDGSLMAQATRLGARVVIGFRGLVDYAPLGRRYANTAGDYFWERFAMYVTRHQTLTRAWRTALRDLVATEHNTFGYQTLVFGGTAKNPGDTRL